MKSIMRLVAVAAVMMSAMTAVAIENIIVPSVGEKTLLHSGWTARRAADVLVDGNTLTSTEEIGERWMEACVPGTVLTTLLHNGLYPDPSFGLNNNLIPDIYNVGRDFYTYWFRCSFAVNEVPAGKRVWLNFRGINYMADIFLNGKRINSSTHEGMFLRLSYEITEYLRTDKPNQLAVIVYPPIHPGNPNGGQGGDGMIARNNTMQYTPGWDWIQPVRDRNTGIWDEVSITTTADVQLKAPYVYSKVPGVRYPHHSKQADATVCASVQIDNHSSQPKSGTLVVTTAGLTHKQAVTLLPHESKEVKVKDFVVKNPKLWWPNGIGEHPLYDMDIAFEEGGTVSDATHLRYGIREITSDKAPNNGGRRFFVNGQKIYMPGGNYINSDWLLRLSPERYRHEIKFHAEMNLRMIRVWGGALLERPEFYDACDEFGMLVFQDLWGTGDCNGAWRDRNKLESRERRWEYPDNHEIFIRSVDDQVKMVRNHPSLCFWCGANEYPLARDIDKHLKEVLFPKLDPNRLYVSFSTDTVFTANPLATPTHPDNGDGPYGIQENEWFFSFRSYPFNPESGSVGSPEVEGMRKIMPERDLRAFPRRGFVRNEDWRYHKDLGYGDHLERYGTLSTIEDYCKYAQVVNYDQYRSFMEGREAKMWDWYTGILIWKTQNPWTALRGQMYDWYLDVNATLYGTRQGCEPVHPLFNRHTREVQLLNSTLTDSNNLTITAKIINLQGEVLWRQSVEADARANDVSTIIDRVPEPEGVDGVYFLSLEMTGATPNTYWLTTKEKDYTSLSLLPKCEPEFTAKLHDAQGGVYKAEVTMRTGKAISFFNRLKVIDKATGELILPVHYTDNYITLMPGESRSVVIEIDSTLPRERIGIVSDSWTAPRQVVL